MSGYLKTTQSGSIFVFVFYGRRVAFFFFFFEQFKSLIYNRVYPTDFRESRLALYTSRTSTFHFNENVVPHIEITYTKKMVRYVFIQISTHV